MMHHQQFILSVSIEESFDFGIEDRFQGESKLYYLNQSEHEILNPFSSISLSLKPFRHHESRVHLMYFPVERAKK
jgi:hypothetical protein